MNKTKPNRFYSKVQETRVAKFLDERVVPGSGCRDNDPGDVKAYDLLIDAKTLVKPQKSHTLQKAWFDKIQEEAFADGKAYGIVCFDFGDGKDIYAVPAKLFKQMYEAWKREVQGNG